MYRAFNMGIGMVLVCAGEHRLGVLGGVADAVVIGEIGAGDRTVQYL